MLVIHFELSPYAVQVTCDVVFVLHTLI